MGEVEWHTSADPARMLAWLTEVTESVYGHPAGRGRKPSDRQLRLWCAALFDLSSHPYAHGAILAAWREGQREHLDGHTSPCSEARMWADPRYDEEGDPPLAVRAALLRDIVGNPFRPTGAIYCRSCGQKCNRLGGSRAGTCSACGQPETCLFPPAMLTPTVVSLARGAYEARREDGTLDPLTLAVLADALEEAGYTDPPGRTMTDVLRARRNAALGGCCDRFADNSACNCLTKAVPEGILVHLRSPGPHVRGCWAVDCVLGKE